MDRLMTAQEVADYLGIPLATLYAMNTRGTSPPRLRVGKFVRWKPVDVAAWVEQRYADGVTPART